MSCSGMAFFPSNFRLHQEEERPQSPINPDFNGAASFLKRPMDVCDEEVNLNGEDEMLDDGSPAGEKKRRLNIGQVKTLERNFELGNKLDPERKMQLARTLGLQPRQIAIWFQNRRARWKTKQLEKDFDVLRRQYDAVKADNELLQAQNQKLHAEIVALKSRDSTESINLNKETDQGSCSNKSENSTEIQLDISRTPGKARRLTESRPSFPATALRQPPQVFFRADHVQLQDETMSSMFCPVDDQSAFWPWVENHHFN